jgi:hypothetical protein
MKRYMQGCPEVENFFEICVKNQPKKTKFPEIEGGVSPRSGYPWIYEFDFF